MLTARRFGRWVCVRLDRTRTGRDRGFSTLEAVALFPILWIVTMLSVQAVLVWHAHNVAEAAAQDALRAARGYQVGDANARKAQGMSAGDSYLESAAGGLWQSTPSVDVTPTANTVSVRVSGRVVEILPFHLGFSVTESATGPIEQVTG